MPLFQGRIVLLVVFAGLACSALNGFLYFTYVLDSYDFLLQHSTLPEALEDQRFDDLVKFGLSLAFITVVATLAIAVWGLFLTHRAAGAIYHLQRVVDEIKAGDLGARVRLRRTDEFQDLANSFNDMMDRLQKRIATPGAHMK